jgi:hypothetical protein
MNQNDIRWQLVERFQARVHITKNSAFLLSVRMSSYNRQSVYWEVQKESNGKFSMLNSGNTDSIEAAKEACFLAIMNLKREEKDGS